MLQSQTTLRMDDGIELRVRQYRPTAAPAGRTLLIVHGLCVHSGRYEHVARAAVERGWNVIVPDLRGHGHSGGVPVFVDRYARYLDDLDELCRQLALAPSSLAMLGHSHGGLMLIRYLQTRPQAAAALVLCSPLLGLSLPIPALTLTWGRLLALVWPTARMRNRVDSEDLSHDTGYLAERKTDSLIHRIITVGWFVEAEQAMQVANATAGSLTVPLLVLQGADDRVVDPLAAQRWTEAAASPDKTFSLLPDHLHELLHETDRDSTLADIFDWLETRVPRR